MQSVPKNRYLAIALPWIIWTIGCLFYFHQYLLRVTVSSLSIELTQSFHFNALTLSNVAAFFFYAYVIFTIPAGLLIDQLGARKIVTTAILSCALGSFIFAMSNSVISIETGRLFMGAGAAFSGVGALTLTRLWFNKKQFGLISGLLLTIGTLGGALGGAPIAKLGQIYGWRPIMFVAGIICVLLMLLAWFAIRDQKSTKVNANNKETWRDIGKKLYLICKQPQIMLCSLYAGLLFVPIATFTTLWGTPFLMAEYAISPAKASLATSLNFIGFAIGCPIIGLLSNKLPTKLITIPTAALVLLVLCGIIYLPNPPFTIMLLLQFTLGLLISSSLMATIIIRTIAAKEIAATAFSIVSMLIPLISAIVLPLTGWILDINWTGSMINNVAVYHLPNYHIALLTVPICVSAALLLTFFLPKSSENNNAK